MSRASSPADRRVGTRGECPRVLRRLRRAPFYLALGAWSLFTIVGLSYVVLGSFKTQRELLRRPWD